MTNTWLTADHHFNHKNIIKYCNRPFDSVEEMNETMIEKWNEKVGLKDDVYYIGDLTLDDYFYFDELIPKLNGWIYFIPGNHDWKWMTHYDAGYSPPYFRMKKQIHTLSIPRYPRIILCHYAMRTWDRSHRGSIHLYGHSHGNLSSYGKSMDVGVDTNSFYPYHIDEIMSLMSKKEIGKHE